MSDGCLEGGFNVVRRDPIDELMIMNDFSSNVNLVINGETLSQNQLIEKLYYGNDEFNKMQNNEFVPKYKPFKKEIELPDEPKPLEPGQIDPNEFFGNSLNGFKF
jgi:hypothetical protein